MGYSSLQRLRTIQVDRLKIDRIFVSELALNPMDACLIRSMIHLAQQLGLSVIAEGIEDAEACVRLQSMGCDQGQGFYFTAALGADACEKYLRDVQHGLRADPCRPGQSSEVYYPAQSLPNPR
jgi:EAL domain-containing protein (putative c-di-GMP-specific phosphodiesterase class I)